MSFLGPAFPGMGWVPAPRYLLRRARILRMMKQAPAGKLLEIGPGAGALLTEFAQRGFDCHALEASEPARHVASGVFHCAGQSCAIHALPESSWAGQFDTIFAFDVLEHIEHDAQALALWASWLRPGGRLLLSVPAHMRLWTAGDEWAGHFRRYERDDLAGLIEQSGLVMEEMECYGFPLSNLTEKISARSYRSHPAQQGQGTRQENNDRSGIDRRPHLRLFPLLKSWPGQMAMRMFCHIQGWFVRTDMGSGYLVAATRPHSEQAP